MHICFITSEYPKAGFPHGGVGTFIKTFALLLVEKGHQVSVLGFNYQNFEEIIIEDKVKIYRLKPNKFKGLTWLLNATKLNKKIFEINKTSPIDVLESAELGLAFLNKIKNIKYVIRLHGGHHFFAESENRGINWWKGFQEKRSFKKADAFIAVSNYVKNHTAKFLCYYNKPIVVIFSPINIQLFETKDVEIDCANITFAGTICEKKGVRQLIQSFPLIKSKFPNAKLNLYGRDWFFKDGRSYIKMLQEVELPKLGHLSEDIIFHGPISYDKMPLIYAKSSVCVFPSHMETLGLVAPEAMLMEKAVIFTKLGPGPEVIQHGENGLLCNPLNPEDIAKQIITVLKDKDLALKLAKNARQTVLEKFDAEKIFLQNIQFYESLIK